MLLLLCLSSQTYPNSALSSPTLPTLTLLLPLHYFCFDRLLIDAATALPVLYVEEAYGGGVGADEETYLPVYDQVGHLPPYLPSSPLMPLTTTNTPTNSPSSTFLIHPPSRLYTPLTHPLMHPSLTPL